MPTEKTHREVKKPQISIRYLAEYMKAAKMQPPSLGRIVHVLGCYSDKTKPAPAMITYVHSATMVNLKVMLDSDQPPLWRSSIVLGEDANANSNYEVRAYWPPRE